MVDFSSVPTISQYFLPTLPLFALKSAPAKRRTFPFAWLNLSVVGRRAFSAPAGVL
jgi:hypothetical protein